VAYTGGEIRRRHESTYIGCPVGVESAINDEANGVRFIQISRTLASTTSIPACASRSVTTSLAPSLSQLIHQRHGLYQMRQTLRDSDAVRPTCRILAEL